MIDFHSHILPGLDDGSRDVTESLALLGLLAEQGVRRVVATPHFYANRESVDRFLQRRRAAYDALRAALPDGLPTISPGAEVRYYGGISHNEELARLCIEGTDLLLLEMPVERWTEHTVRELVDLAGRGDLTVVLAHAERYRRLQSRRTWEYVLRCGVLVQANADWLLSFSGRRRALRQLAGGEIHLIGSDCHGVSHRPPHIGAAFRLIRSRLGDSFTDDLFRFHHHLFPIEEAGASSKT